MEEKKPEEPVFGFLDFTVPVPGNYSWELVKPEEQAQQEGLDLRRLWFRKHATGVILDYPPDKPDEPDVPFIVGN